MKTRRKLMLIATATTLLLTLLVVGTVVGQEIGGSDDGDDAPPPTMGEPADFPEVADEGSEGQEDAEGVTIAAQPPYTMNYQGYLTDNSGIPLNGTYALRFWLYDAAAAGNLEWGPETINGVQVRNGLFSVVLGGTLALQPNDFDEALFLQVAVNGVILSARQPVRTVAYAFGLVPGAEVSGDPQGTTYGLYVNNTGSDDSDRGIYAKGRQYGLYVEETGAGNVAIKSPDFVEAGGYKSTGDSYLWVPGTAGISGTSAGATVNVRISLEGSAILEVTSAGANKYFYLPVSLPTQLYGQEVRVEQMCVYYKTTNAGSYIDQTRLYKVTAAGSGASLIDDATNRTSTSAGSYCLTPGASTPYTLTAGAGALNAQLRLDFASTSHDITIGGIRIRLGHTD